MRNAPKRVENQGYVLAWDSDVPMYGDSPLPHDFVAVMGVVFIDRAKFEAFGKFKSHRAALVEFDHGSLSVNVFKAAGSKAWFKMQLSKCVKDALDVAYHDRSLTGAGKTRRTPCRNPKKRT